MNSITDMLIELGGGLLELIRSEQALYGIYLVSFLFAIYALFGYLLREKVSLFEGQGRKAANVVAFMVSVITTGAIFYGSDGRSAQDLLALFHGFGGFIVILIISISFGAGAFFLYNKYKDSNKNLALFYLFLGLYVASSLLLPQFSTSLQESISYSTTITDNYQDTYFVYSLQESGGYVAQRAGETFGVLGGIISIIQTLSFALMIIFLIMLIVDLFKQSNGSNHQSMAKRIDEKEVKNKKDIKAAKSMLKDIINELKGINDHMNNKINMLNTLRSRVIPSVESSIREGEIREEQQNKERDAAERTRANQQAQDNQGGPQNV